jgi:hypothetical protein
MRDCRTCEHNTYKDIDTDWVSCSHPIAIRKSVKWEPGDPAFVSVLTGDIEISRIHELANCPTWEQRTSVGKTVSTNEESK